MGDVLLKKDGKVQPFPEELVPQAAASGWELAAPARTLNEGQTVLPGSARELGGLVEQGATLEDEGAGRAAQREGALEERYGSSPVTAAALGLGSGLSLGGLDLAVEALGSEDLRRFMHQTAQRNRPAFIAGQVGSAIIPGMALSKGGLLARAIRMTPAGAATRLGQMAGIATSEAMGAARAGSLFGRAAQLGVEGVAEGVPYAAGQAMSDAVIDNKPLSAESMIAQMGTGALIGGGLGAGMGALGGVLERAARRRIAASDSVFEKVGDLGSAEAKGFRDQVRQVGEALDTGHDAVAGGLDADIERLEGGVGRRFEVHTIGTPPAQGAAKVDRLTRELEAVQKQLGDLDAGRPLTGQGVRLPREKRLAKLQANLERARLDLAETRATLKAGEAGEGALGRAATREKQLAARVDDIEERLGQTRKGAGGDAPVEPADFRGQLERRQAGLQTRLDEAMQGTPAQSVRAGMTREEAWALTADLRSQGKRTLVREVAADEAGLEALRQAKSLRAELADGRAGVDGLLHGDDSVRRWSDEALNDVALAGKPEDFRRFRAAANSYHEVVRKAAGARSPEVLKQLDELAAALGKVPEAGERFAGMSATDLLAAANEAGVIDVDDIPVVGPVADLLLKGRLLFHTAPGLLGGVVGRAAGGKIGRIQGFARNSIQRSVSINVARGSKLKGLMGALLPGFGGKLTGDALAGMQGALTGAGAKGMFDNLAGIGVAAEKSARHVEAKIEAAVTSFIKAKRASRKLIPAAVTILDKVHFGGAEPAQRKRGMTPYQKRAAELREAMANMPATERQLAATLEPVRMSNPGLFDLMYRTAMRRLTFLAMKLPKNPGQGSAVTGFRDYEPPRYEQMRFARYVAATENPLSMLDSLSHGAVTPEEVEALRAVYPEIYRATQSFLVQYLPKHADEISYDRRVQLSILFGVAADSSMRPDFVQSIQGLYAAEAQKAMQASPPSRTRATSKVLGTDALKTSAQRLAD